LSWNYLNVTDRRTDEQTTCHDAILQGRIARISVWGATGRARQRRKNRGAEGGRWVCGVGMNVPALYWRWVWGGDCVPLEFFLNFYIKMVSCRGFWVAISYRLTACFSVLPESEESVEFKFIGDRSSIFGTIIQLHPPEKCVRKMTKMCQKLVKMRENCVVFLYISRRPIYSVLKFLWVVDWGLVLVSCSPPDYAPAIPRGNNESVVIVFCTALQLIYTPWHDHSFMVRPISLRSWRGFCQSSRQYGRG